MKHSGVKELVGTNPDIAKRVSASQQLDPPRIELDAFHSAAASPSQVDRL